ncbi:hypothetical protein DCS_02446 [Drechmeria coniospora]|uniref:TauD/TfdA-like domain-containing protein n=1 Tax=Drechmeria coniospora TaxID=98403 RepID=A0A151GW28_DRECN|nr:hypothetical protein DCS_02446 [Drechmeria coniospora]KYK61304.1 hypothetical protein DCS_02446 [Drechmeria coniospora]
MPSVSKFWLPSPQEFQKHIQIVPKPGEPTVPFPLVIEPSNSAVTVADVLESVRTELSPRHGDTLESNPIRTLLDQNGGAVYLKSLPLRSVDDFSQFLDALSGTGKASWYPYDPVAMNVLRKVRAKNVLTVNEYSSILQCTCVPLLIIARGPPSHVIMWHSEFSISPSHPAYVVFFCLKPAESGGKTGISSSLAVCNRLRAACPRFLQACVDKGFSYPAPHHVAESDSIFFGNGLYKKTAFGPADGQDISSFSEQEKRHIVEGRIRELARLGGWKDSNMQDMELPAWQQRGFDWVWRSDGVDVYQRVPGLRVHPTRKTNTLFTALGSRYINAKNRKTFDPPHTWINEDGKENVYLPPMYAGVPEDELIPEKDLDTVHGLQQEFAVEIDWEIGDVLIIDNFAVQHSRLPWTGDRRIMASFWDQDGLNAEAVTTMNIDP